MMRLWGVRSCGSLVLFPAVLLAVLTAGAVRADVRLPAILGSNMVLQRDMPIQVWGWADADESVTVAIGSNQAQTKAGPEGRWQVQLAPQPPGEALEMTVSGKNTLTLTNILVGEVWLGSGQSNMQWAVSQSLNPQEEIAAATFPKIRLFLVPLVPAGTPALDVNARWVECSPQTVGSFSAVLYFFGRHLHQELNGAPLGLIASSWGGTRIEPWIPPVGFESQPDLDKELAQLRVLQQQFQPQLRTQVQAMKEWVAKAEEAIASGKQIPPQPPSIQHPLSSNSAATGLYNGMIHPLVPFALRGAIWYQGESNNGQAMHYHSLMKGLIAGWRSVWNQPNMPFYYTQLAPFRYGGAETALPGIWEAQTATLAVPHTGMAVTTDIGNVADIHPRNKQELGRRLALWALAHDYGKTDLVYSGPLYESHSVELEEVRIKFKHAAGGLASRDGKPLTWFTIAGADKKFHVANAQLSGDTVVVSSAKVNSPVAVRFGWSQLAEPNLMNKAGLPASPFRTDAWNEP